MSFSSSNFEREPKSVCNISSIEVRDLVKEYGDKKVLNRINISVCAGETIAVIGPSGTGKSTFLKILSGLEEKDSGQVIIREKNIGMVFQYSALLNSYTIGENIAFALHDSGFSEKKKKDLVMEKLEVVGLPEYFNSMPAELSGGQQKRASFARAVVNDPKIVLYDEPTAGLDPITSTIIEDYMNKLSRCEHTTGIVVTHQHSTIRRTADRIICLNKGKIVWEGNISEIDTSHNPYIRQFMDGKTEGPFTSSSYLESKND
ncbi:MAG: ATP-binding cassette domain-containing protein [Candidatus Caenarcaniphilales bacterium]|nr:ATP-binding cassette domain-containing protein [Candidatus Caenarcaniphilales bacterium]